MSDFSSLFTENGKKVLESRYLRQNEEGKIIETPREMFFRIAHHIASKESDPTKWENEYFNVMSKLEFVPGGRTISLAGTNEPLISNCVVLHIDDSLDSIFQTLQDACLLHKAGSGVGFPFHLLRPAGYKCKRTLGSSSGPISFLQIYSEAFRPISQHNRESANIAIMKINHPDILEFIAAKCVDGKFSNFNFSIALTDEFFEKATSNPTDLWMCEWNGTKMKPRNITRDSSGRIISIEDVDITVGDLFEKIVKYAWGNGEPGCVFIDTVNKFNQVPGLGKIECCNPCGEQFLHDGDACNLGSINLEKFVKLNDQNQKIVDFDKLGNVTKTAVRFLDAVVDLTEFPVDRVNNTFKGNRRIGLGIMGLADLLFLLQIPYDSDEGRATATEVMKHIQESAIAASAELGLEKGSFPNFPKSIWAKQFPAFRNASLTNVAPTGSVSMLCDVSSGIEPYFALAYKRTNCLSGAKMQPFVNKHLAAALKAANCFNSEIMDKVLQTGTLNDVPGIPEAVKKVFVTSLDISPMAHVQMQSQIQKYCCNAISKTVNFKNDATVDDVRKVYIEAWKFGCKGMTVYRNGSRENQVLEVNSTKETSSAPVQTFITTCKDGKCDL